MNNYKTVVEFPVHWGECDMLGHVNHTRFLVWMETARITLFDRVGLVTQDAPEFGPILANISVNYRAPVKFPSTVVCGTRVSRIGRTSFSMEYGLWLADEPNALVADATAVIVVVNYSEGKSQVIWDSLRRGLEDQMAETPS